MAALTINCSRKPGPAAVHLGSWTNQLSAPAHKNGEWQKVSYKKTRVKKVQPRTRRSSFPAIGNAVAHKVSGSWSKKLEVKDSTTVAHTTRFQPKVKVQDDKISAKKKDWERRYAFWMKKEAERKAAKKKEMQEMRAAQLKQAEAMLAAKFAAHPVDEAISRGHVSVRSKPKKVDLKDNRFEVFNMEEARDILGVSQHSLAKARRRVSFKGDNVDTLMKPPCETKVFDAAAPASSVSSDEDTQVYPDEDEYIRKKRSKTAWKPKFQMTPDELKKKLDGQKKVKKKSWADICDEESDDEDDFDQFGRPTTDNSAW